MMKLKRPKNIKPEEKEQAQSISRTCLTIKVPSLEGVMTVSLSASSCRIMVSTDSVSPLLTFEELKERQMHGEFVHFNCKSLFNV